ncbi:type II toxin-antitoxin system VapC family toxin [Cyanobium sp. FGCU-6]|nr:type II toxin-antitoxin system VapC family toxin [Cyanobium sp. FGCU6]
MAAEPGTWVVDASVAFGWFAAVPGSDQAVRLLDGGPTTVLLAPDLVLVELLNAAWKSLRQGAIPGAWSSITRPITASMSPWPNGNGPR